jgi:tetratricopeptide (TPR) repeat protein
MPTAPAQAPAPAHVQYTGSNRKDTVFISAPPQQQPTAVNVQVQMPRDSLRKTDTVKVGASSDEVKAKELKWAEISDEVMADLRRAQEYFYKQDYSSAIRMVKAAQEKRSTAEGFALQGSIHYMLGDKGAARFFWTEALNLNPELPEVIQALSKLDQAQESR